MSDAETAERRAIPGERYRLNKDVYLAACLAKGATRQEDRATLFGLPRRSLIRYENHQVEPRVTVMRHIAARLDRPVDELWPAA